MFSFESASMSSSQRSSLWKIICRRQSSVITRMKKTGLPLFLPKSLGGWGFSGRPMHFE
jgi:hypothetical protein